MDAKIISALTLHCESALLLCEPEALRCYLYFWVERPLHNQSLGLFMGLWWSMRK